MILSQIMNYVGVSQEDDYEWALKMYMKEDFNL